MITAMQLKILLPFTVFAELPAVTRIVAETRQGAYGLLPRRQDCVLALRPGILIYETENQGEVFVAVDEGVLVKAGAEVLVSVRRAMGGTDLAGLREAVQREYLIRSEEEQGLHQVMARLEVGFVRRLEAIRHG